MTIPQTITHYYLFFLGVILCVLSIFELTMPAIMFTFWKKIISSFLARIYGLMVMLSGIIITTYKGNLSFLVFITGIIMAILGPVSIMYPEIFKKAFTESSEILDHKSKVKLIKTEGIMHIIMGSLFVYAGHKSIIKLLF